MVSVERLLEERLLKRIAPSRERALKSLERSEKFLKDARNMFDKDLDEMTILAVYESLFHAARAVLFADGYAERSHYAICVYLREKRQDLGLREVNGLDLYRELRHSVAYGLDAKMTPKDSSEAINFAQEFLSAVKKTIK